MALHLSHHLFFKIFAEVSITKSDATEETLDTSGNVGYNIGKTVLSANRTILMMQNYDG